MKKKIVSLIQYPATWISAMLNNIFLYPDIRGIENLYQATKLRWQNGLAIVFIANHLSANDPFVITAMLPHALKKNLFPINFLVKRELFSNFFKSCVMSLLGCIPVGNGKGQNVREVIRMIQKGETIFLFPEGKVSADGSLGEDLGALEMFAKFSDMVVQPIRIGGLAPFRKSWKEMFSFQHQVVVSFGAPFVLRKGLAVNAVDLIAQIRLEEAAKLASEAT